MMKTTPNQLREQMEGWRVQSPDGEGFHKVIAPDISDCKAISLYRLNLPKGKTYLLHSEEQEMNGAVIKGTAVIRSQRLDQTLHKLDSFFICPNVALEIQAAEDMVVHPVQSGTMVLAPRGYHPTVAMPGTVNAYFWALAAFTPASRRYDLAVTDPELVKETGEVSV